MNVWIRDGFEDPQRQSDLRVVIDVFRASTTTLAILESHVKDLLIANDFDFLTKLNQQGYQIISEVFAMGIDNSPTLVKQMNLHDRQVALKTANLTTAIEKNYFDGLMVIGCFNNLSAIVDFVQHQGFQNVEIIPAGFMESQSGNLEDTHCAEVLLQKLTTNASASPDVSLLAEHIQEKIEKHQRTNHYIEDMHLAVTADISKTIPVVKRREPHSAVFTASPWSP